MKIILVRHGKDDDGYRGGWSRNDLTPEGRRQAKQLAEYLKENSSQYRIGKIISSDLPRAMSTAQFIADALNLPVQAEPQLREMNNGDLAGMPDDEALVRFPGLFFGSLRMNEPYPNGESPDDFFLRIKKWFDEFVQTYENADENILAVTHGGVISIIHYLVNGTEWTNKSPVFKTENCGICILNTDTMKFEAENLTDFLTHA